MRPAQQRKAQRAAHLLAASVLIAYVYAPISAELHDTVRFIVVPVLVLTGVAMWQAARLRGLGRGVARKRAALGRAASSSTSEKR